MLKLSKNNNVNCITIRLRLTNTFITAFKDKCHITNSKHGKVWPVQL